MTRSMGDLVAASVGVSHEPEITEYTLKADDRIIVLGIKKYCIIIILKLLMGFGSS